MFSGTNFVTYLFFILSYIYFLFQAPQGYQIMMYFPFKKNGLRTSWLGCYHWLELSNSRLVVDEDDNCKFRLKRVNDDIRYILV